MTILWPTVQTCITLLRYADKRIVNIMKVCIERNNWQIGLTRYRKHVYFILVCFTTRRMQCNIAHRLGTEIFTRSACLFARWQHMR